MGVAGGKGRRSRVGRYPQSFLSGEDPDLGLVKTNPLPESNPTPS